jgi:hypothetical protein
MSAGQSLESLLAVAAVRGSLSSPRSSRMSSVSSALAPTTSVRFRRSGA